MFVNESLQEIEILHRQLEKMSCEKFELGVQLEGQKEELISLKNEIIKLKSFQEKLNDENNLLRSRLRDVAHSPLSDNEKQQLLLDSHRHHNSAPASIATNVSLFSILN